MSDLRSLREIEGIWVRRMEREGVIRIEPGGLVVRDRQALNLAPASQSPTSHSIGNHPAESVAH